MTCSGDRVAIEQVSHYMNREIQIMQELKHPNIVQLKHAFYTPGGKPNDLYLNLVMEYLSDSVYRVIKGQALSRLSLHSLGICHRDIKPQNLASLTSITSALASHCAYPVYIHTTYITEVPAKVGHNVKDVATYIAPLVFGPPGVRRQRFVLIFLRVRAANFLREGNTCSSRRI